MKYGDIILSDGLSGKIVSTGTNGALEAITDLSAVGSADDIVALSADLVTVSGDLDALSAAINLNISNISDNTTDIGVISADLATVSGDLDALEAKTISYTEIENSYEEQFLKYTHDNSDYIDSDPGSGFFKGNAALTSCTEFYIANTDANGNNIISQLIGLKKGSILKFSDRQSTTNALVYKVTGSYSGASGYYKIPVEKLSGGSFTNNAIWTLNFIPFDDIYTDIDTLSSDVSSNTSNISTNTSNITSISAQVISNDVDISTLSARTEIVGSNGNYFIRATGEPAGVDGTNDDNIGIGDGTLTSLNGNEDFNVAIGLDSIRSLTTGQDNVGIGRGSIYSVTNGTRNVGIGYAALNTLPSGTDNVAVGPYAGWGGQSGISSLTNGTYIGNYAKPTSGTIQNETAIGANSNGKGSNSVSIGDELVTAFYVADQEVDLNVLHNLGQLSADVVAFSASVPAYAGIENIGLGTAYASSGTKQVTDFDTNMASSGATPDHTNDHITIDTAGDYEITFECSYEDSDIAEIIPFTIRKNNGATTLAATQIWATVSTNEPLPVHISTIQTLAVNDTIEAWFVLSSSSNLQLRDTRLLVKRLG